jgi:hypothetical protein
MFTNHNLNGVAASPACFLLVAPPIADLHAEPRMDAGSGPELGKGCHCFFDPLDIKLINFSQRVEVQKKTSPAVF